jgi:hypothetical protein
MISIGYGTFWVSSGVTARPGSKSWRSAHRGTLVKSFSTIDQMISAARSVGRSSAYSSPWNQHVVGLCCMKHEGAEYTGVLSTVDKELPTRALRNHYQMKHVKDTMRTGVSFD